MNRNIKKAIEVIKDAIWVTIFALLPVIGVYMINGLLGQMLLAALFLVVTFIGFYLFIDAVKKRR